MTASVDRIVLNPLKGALVATLQGALTTPVLESFKTDVLKRLDDKQVSYLILDFAGMEMMDPDEFGEVMNVAKMSQLMGAEPIVAGLRPEVVFSLIQLGVETSGVRAVLSVDDAFERLEKGETFD